MTAKSLSVFAFFSLFLSSCMINDIENVFDFQTNTLKMSLNNKGIICSLTDLKTGKDYLCQDSISALMSIRVDHKIIYPSEADILKDTILLRYENGVEAKVKVEEKETHLAFELISIKDSESIDLIIWGPYSTIIRKIIGETVGVVRSDEYAIGIQSLNIKTLGGFPWNESDRMPNIDIFERNNPNDLFAEDAPAVLYRVEAARPIQNGSSLQAYCRNRNKSRIIQEFNHEKIMAPPYKDGGVIGSRIALFGVPVADALKTLGRIELIEDLPHPMINGQWGKTSPEASATYLITSFTEENVDKAIALTKKAGLKYLYHYGKTFENWGHFELYSGEFPNGIEGLKECVEKAAEQGVMVGTHVLSNFITTNDPYVTPVPDKRLAVVGNSVIEHNIDAQQKDILIQSPEFFNQYKNNTLKTAVLENELIRYEKVSEQAPWKLLNCQRGAFNTKSTAHDSGTRISKLLDHAYKVFLTNADLTIEMSEKLADLYNQTGLRQISFDGLEGNRSTGLGTYGESLMPYTWYNNLNASLKNHLIIDASRTTHFFWHIYTRMNWGEPWYGGFRESQTEYRLKNQKYFKRNFMPAMLGWFKMTSETSLEDVEWLCARSAGYDAGYAFVADLEAIDQNGSTNIILDKIGSWEKLRIGGFFTVNQKAKMQIVDNEFVLESIDDRTYHLQQVYSGKYRYFKKVKQPGEPLTETFEFDHVGSEQPLQVILKAVDSDVNNITIEVDRFKTISLPVELKKGQIFYYKGLNYATIFSETWQPLGEVDVNASDFMIKEGKHLLSFDCNFRNGGKESSVQLEIRTYGTKEVIDIKNE